MGHSLSAAEWKPEEPTRNHSQSALALRVVRFMRITGSLAPLQWIADQMGCDVVVRDVSTARIRALEAELNRLKEAA
jgi:hypothetical protein